MLTVLIEISHQWPYILVLIVFSPYWLRPQIQVVNIEGAIGTTTPDSELCQVNFVEGGSRFENERRRHRDVMIHIFQKKHNYATTTLKGRPGQLLHIANCVRLIMSRVVQHNFERPILRIQL